MAQQYTSEQIDKFEEYRERERRVTLMLYGLRETDLNEGQKAALDEYMRVANAVYLAIYGPTGPRGAHLREETQEESTARWAFEDAIKPPEQKLQERIGELACNYCTDQSNFPEEVHVTSIAEEDDETQRGYWLEHGDIQKEDRLYQVHITDGYRTDHVNIEVWISLHPGDELEIIQARCISIEVSWHFYPVRNLHKMTAEDREDLNTWR